PSPQVAADQGEIPDQVQHLVPAALVDKAETVVHRPCCGNNQQLLWRQVLTQSAGAELFGLVLKHKRSRRRKVLDEIVAIGGGEADAEGLTADWRGRLEVVNHFQAAGWAGQGAQRRALRSPLHALP